MKAREPGLAGRAESEKPLRRAAIFVYIRSGLPSRVRAGLFLIFFSYVIGSPNAAAFSKWLINALISVRVLALTLSAGGLGNQNSRENSVNASAGTGLSS